MKKCAFPGCSQEFSPASQRSKYCAGTHHDICPQCGKKTLNRNPSKRRDYCSKECRFLSKKITRNCKHCQREFTPTSPNQLYCTDSHYMDCEICGKPVKLSNNKDKRRFCSMKCAAEVETYERVCEICGKDYISKKSDSKYCSPKHNANCIVCEESFLTSSYNPAKTCSPKCAATLVDVKASQKRQIQTMQEKYGVSNPSQLESVKKKKTATTMKNYGVANPSQAEEIKERREKTMIERYGVPNALHSKKIREQILLTNMKRYGYPNPGQVPEFKEKIKTTMLEKYVVENIFQVPEIQERAVLANGRRISKVNKEWKERLAEELGIEFKFEAEIGEGLRADLGYGDILVEINPSVTHNVTLPFGCLLKKCEKPCSEHQPLKKSYHQERFLVAEANGKTLLQWFDWMDKDIFVSVLRSKLKLDEVKIGARKCDVREISQTEANRFFAENHLLGGSQGQSFCVGVFYEGELVHAQSYGKARFNPNFQWEAIRSCSKQNHHVQGALRKADAFFINSIKPSSIVSYVDLAISTGEAEASNPGWELLTTNRPSSTWVNLFGREELPNTVRSSTARRVSADRLLGFEVGERYPKFLEDGTKVTNDMVLESEGFLEVFDVGSRTFGWSS